MIKLPVRIDFIGGWTDQADWDGPKAVINAAVGWDGYPVIINKGQVLSKIEGIGTGLGLSSIIEAGKFLETNPKGNYVDHVLNYEHEMGVKGGWQDQIGAIEPGFKLISGPDQPINRCDTHPIMNQIVIFDTGIRRKSGDIGESVRSKIKNGELKEKLTEVAYDAIAAFYSFDAIIFSNIMSRNWAELTRIVPEMQSPLPIPKCNDLIGWKLCGAGGGGYGIAIASNSDTRQYLIEMFQAYGMNAAIPRLMEVSYD